MAAGPFPSLSSRDREHIARLRDCYSVVRPENVDRVEELFKAHGEKIWKQLEETYPGKTAQFTKVRVNRCAFGGTLRV
jgi:hypothetical protein